MRKNLKQVKEPEINGESIDIRISDISKYMTDIDREYHNICTLGGNTIELAFAMQAFQIYTKLIAIALDKSYTNNIRCCKYLWVINDYNGKPYKIYQNEFKHKEWVHIISNFGAFRNRLDAITCICLSKDLFKRVFK